MMRSVLVIGLVLCSSLPVSAQPAAPEPPSGEASSSTPARHPDEGRPFIRTYGPAEFSGDNQNWAIVQDPRGVLYVGSSSGVLEFDGSTWRLIETPSLVTVRSLAIDANGRIYVGSVGEFGYLDAEGSGELRFVSLKPRLPKDAPPFADVWRTHATPDGVVFQAEDVMFRFVNDAIQVFRPRSYFNRAALVNGRIYVATPETGLNVLDGQTFRSLPGTLALAREVYGVVLGYDERRLLVGTRANGLFLYDGTALTPFVTELDDLFKTQSLYRGTELSDGSIALATTGGGFGIIDRQGRRLALVDAAHGLPTTTVYYVMPDREGAIWAALDRGLARIDTPSPVSYFDRADGFDSAFNVIRHEGVLYLGSQQGVSYMHQGPEGARLSPVTALSSQCWWFADMRDESDSGTGPLAVACSDGLFEIRGTRAVPIRAPADGTYRASTLLRSKLDPTRLWVGKFDGFASFRRVGGRWIDEGDVDVVRDEVRSLAENPDGSLWLGTSSRGLLRLTFASRPAPGTPRPVATVERFGSDDGLPGEGVFVARIFDELYFHPWGPTTKFVVARFDERSRTFVPDKTLTAMPTDRYRIAYGLAEGPNGRVLANFGRGTAVLSKTADGSWSIDTTTFSRFGQMSMGLPLVDPDGVAWFQLDDRFVRFDLSKPASARPVAFPVLVRRVTSQPDRVLFGGAGSVTVPRLAAADGTLRFEYAAPTFLDETATEFQTRLEGLDDDWSSWTNETRRDFTNLGFGDYRFQVRARNVAGQVGEEAAYAFTVLPPWYRTWTAYAGYVLLLGLAVYGADRIQRRRLVRKERERAQIAEARLRAQAAEALARSESEGKKQVELLSDIGREITASLDFETIFGRLYERVNQLADADVFGVGLYHPERHEIEYRLAIEGGKRYAPYSRDTTDPNQLPVWCIEHRQPVFINDLRAEYGKYLTRYDEPSRALEDGTMSREPQSIIYLPLIAKDRVLGIITIHSFEKHAYTEHHLNVLRTLATYTAIALDNAAAYRQLNEKEHEIRRLFEEAQRARAVAEEADAAKSAFLSTVSHELRTPLTSVLGFAKIIKKRLEDRIFPLVPTDDRRISQTIQQVDDNLKVVVSEGERLTKLIDDVLDLAKIEAGKLEWHMDRVSVADVIDHATAATSSLFEQKGLRVIKEIESGLPEITGDRDRLIQVVINLISNAVKFTDKGSVTCRASRNGGDLVISIIDTGMGIAPADQPKVFERFKQVGDTLTDKPKGTGLGLPICREIVEHHGGRIWVESALGQGSTFSFRLPLPATVAELARRDGPMELGALIRQLRDQVVVTTPRTADRRPRILVADDEANIRELLTQEFTDAGYDVTTAVNGREAISKIRVDRPDLVVLDVMMPEMNGFDVAAVLKNDPATMDIPIVILSIVQDRERGYRIGVDRYFTKPINTDLLFREVGALLEQKKSHRRVLVVDEDATTIKTLTDVLTARGYSVTEAPAADLVARAVAEQPDIILLNAVFSAQSDAARMLRFEKGLENVLFLVYQ